MWASGACVVLAVCLLTRSGVQATVAIYSSCQFPIYYKTIVGTEEPYQQLPSDGATIGYQSNLGVSVKFSTDSAVLEPITPQGPILQLEFTWNPTAVLPKLFYDLSNINGAPFAETGMLLQPSSYASQLFPSCLPVGCPAGNVSCPSVYTNPDGNNTMVCDGSTDLTLSLCTPMPVSARRRHLRSRHIHDK